MAKLTLKQYLKQVVSVSTTQSYLYTINHFLTTNPKAKRYQYKNIIAYMEEVSRKQTNVQYRIRILSAIKSITITCL